jgi:hypothetical protein
MWNAGRGAKPNQEFGGLIMAPHAERIRHLREQAGKSVKEMVATLDMSVMEGKSGEYVTIGACAVTITKQEPYP